MIEAIAQLRALAAEARRCAEDVGNSEPDRVMPIAVRLTWMGLAAGIDDIADQAEQRAAEAEPQADWAPSRLARWLWS